MPKTKKVPLRELLWAEMDHIKIGRKMYAIDSNKEFYAEHRMPPGYNNILNNLEKDVDTFTVHTISYSPENTINQVVQNNRIITRDNSEFKYQLVGKQIPLNTIQLRELTKIYGLDYKVKIKIVGSSTRKILDMLDNKTIDDAQLNSKLGHIGKHFKIDIYKDSTIIGGKIVKNKK